MATAPRNIAVSLDVSRMTDREIMLRARGHPEWFGEIYHRHFAAIRRYLARRVGSAAADDIAADTFMAAFTARRRFSASYVSARPWLFGIASNLLRQHFRRTRRASLGQATFGGRGDFEDNPWVRSTERLDAARVARKLRSRVEALPERELSVLLMRVEYDLTYTELAEVLGIPVGTVRSRLSRARARIQQVDPSDDPAARAT